MNPSALSSAIAQPLQDVPSSIRHMDEQAQQDEALMATYTHARGSDKPPRDNRGSRDTAPDNAFGVPEASPTSGTSDAGSLEPGPHFELVVTRDATHTAPGVYWCDVDTERNGAPPAWVCSPLRVEAFTRNAEGNDWGRLLVFPDKDGKVHRWTCPQSIHAGNGDELRAVLLGEGLTITSNPKLRRMVGDYIQRATPKVRARCVTRTGWHGDVFVLPRETFGGCATEPVLFQSATLDGVALGHGGTLAGWTEAVAAPCAGNSRLVMALAAAFAAPCVGLVNAEGGGVHLRGPSSIGKSTASQVAASVFGRPRDYMRNWRATDNGLEGVAAIHSDLLLVLDEMGQADARRVGEMAYMLTNGQGKSRSHRDGTPRATPKWRLLFLSTGEVGLADLVAQSGGRVYAGQEVRVIDVPADTGKQGLFEVVPDGMTAGAFADALRDAAAVNFGHALPAFLDAVLTDPGKARDTLRNLRAEVVDGITPKGAAGQVRRVADRFALIAAAGELATVYRLTGWVTGEATRATEACFKAWLSARGTPGNSEPMAMVEQVRAFLGTNSEARFTPWNAGTERLRTANRAGFRKDGESGPTYYIERECFRKEVCKGFDHRAVERVLTACNALVLGSGNEATRKERLPDRRSARVYVIGPALWGDA